LAIVARAIETVYHLVDAGNWPSVQKSGLMSARRLMEASGKAGDIAPRRHRSAAQRLASGVLIRNQKPMPPAALARCLRSGLKPDDWFELLNSKVFFWLDVERLNRQRQACRDAPQIALVVDARRLLAKYVEVATVAPINTGNAMRAAAPRNRSTFVPYERWVADGWKDEAILDVPCRPANHRPVELTIDDAVPDIMEFVARIVPLGVNEALTMRHPTESNASIGV
jgi:hypothetical protein